MRVPSGLGWTALRLAKQRDSVLNRSLGRKTADSYMRGRVHNRTGCRDASRHIVTNLAVHIRVDLSRRFPELAVFGARLYIRVRHIDEPA